MSPPISDQDSEREQRLYRELQETLEREDWDSFHDAVEGVPTPEIADALHRLEDDQRHTAFRAFPRRLAARLVAHVSPERAGRLLDHLDDDHRRTVFHYLQPDDRVQLLENLPDETTRELMNLLDKSDIEETRKLLQFPDESVG